MKNSLLKEYVEMVLLESRLDDLKSANPDLPVDELWAKDPSPTKKYVAWMVKQVKAGANPSDVTASIHAFHKNTGKFKSKDINSYKTAKDLEDEVKRVEAEGPSKHSQKKEHKSGAVKVQENGECVVFRMDSKNACVQYGKGTKWCITMANQRYYEDYSEKNVVFYFILPKEPNNPSLQRMGFDYSKVAIAFQRDENNKIINSEAFDAQDNPVVDLGPFVALMEDEHGNTIDLQQIENDAEAQPSSFEFAVVKKSITPEMFLKRWNNAANDHERVLLIQRLWNMGFGNSLGFREWWKKVQTEFAPKIPQAFWRQVLGTYEASAMHFALFRPNETDFSMPAVINNRNMRWEDEEGSAHRDGDLPAVIYWDGEHCWYNHGKRHRENGPAVINTQTGEKVWFIKGRELTPEEVSAKETPTG